MAQQKKLNLGYSDFKYIIENNNYYVDKSLFIEELINFEKAVVLLPRPRRFGKTMNLSMLRYFFDITQPENKKLFQNLKIWKASNEIKNHCLAYPVIYLSLKDIKANTWEGCYELLASHIANLYKEHIYLLDSDSLHNFEKKKFNQILSENATPTSYKQSLKELSELLARFHKKNTLILVDEYDTPIQSGYNNYYDEIVTFMRSLLSGAFKDNKYLFKGVITGILRVSRESIFSGLNNLDVCSILNYDFADKFGFTKSEVKQILSDFKISDKFDKVKKWYNGYKFGDTPEIYNPWSVLNYTTKTREGFQGYWTQTSTNDLIKSEIKKKDAEIIRADILTLMNNKPLERDIEENFIFQNLKTNKDLLWSLLVYSGYLTIVEKISRKKYSLKIPNYEIKTVFQDTITEWLNEDIKIRKTLLEETTENLINNKIAEFEQGFKSIMGDTFSYYDTGKVNEYVYHSYLLGLLAIIGDDYVIKSNRESGEGRYDILLIPHKKAKYGVVIEIKQINKQNKTENSKDFKNKINNKLRDAKNQIEKNKYFKELIDCKIPEEQIIKLPIVFAGKEVFINEQK